MVTNGSKWLPMVPNVTQWSPMVTNDNQWFSPYIGNRYSLGHLPPKPDRATFWDFSWDEMAEHDIPAMLAHMMQVHTNNTIITIIVHTYNTIIFTVTVIGR